MVEYGIDYHVSSIANMSYKERERKEIFPRFSFMQIDESAVCLTDKDPFCCCYPDAILSSTMRKMVGSPVHRNKQVANGKLAVIRLFAVN